GVMGAGLARYLPNVPMFESMILGPPGANSEAEPRLRPDATGTAPGSGEAISIGQQGQALTMLRPSGKARLNDRVFDVVSEGPFITPETQIEVIAITGNRIVVRQV
ncbi:MAG: NfeD family protein, partial [Candidatus Saccharimonas sp.]|nr:NfeD family protein [Planctomycetaceae bacterium]